MKALTTPFTLAEIAAAQAERTIFAFDRNFSQRLIARLQAIYAAKVAQLEAFHYLFEEGTPDIVLRTADGREVVLRLRQSETGDVYAALRDALDNELCKLEQEIVSAHLTIEEDAKFDAERPREEPDYGLAIVALCQPSQATAQHLSVLTASTASAAA